MSLNIIKTVAFVGGILSLLLAPASSNFLDNSLIGDFSSVSDMSPQVVINFLGHNAGVSIDTSSCLVSTFIADTFGNEKWGDRCSPFEDSEVSSLVKNAFDVCDGDGNVDSSERDVLETVLSHSASFSKLCSEHSQLDVESTWMRTCADVTLPYSKAKMDGMFTIMADEEDVVLSCMLHEAMSSPPSQFGLSGLVEGSINNCYPPGYPMMETFCTESLAPVVFSRCYDANIDSTGMMSMNTGFQGNEEDLASDFCTLMTTLSAQDNRECLVALCDYDAPPMDPIDPIVDSSATPSAMPSVAPSTVLSSTPSASPSSQPTHSEVQSIVETTVLSEFTLLGISNGDVGASNLNDFFGVLSDSIAAVVDDLDQVTGDVLVEIVLLGSIPNRRRLRELQGGQEPALDVEFKGTVSTECFLTNCTDASFAANIAEEFKGALTAAIPVALTTKINEEATAQNVNELKSPVTVESKALSDFTFSSRVLSLEEAAVSAGFIETSGTMTALIAAVAFAMAIL